MDVVQLSLLLVCATNALIHWYSIIYEKTTLTKLSKTPFCVLMALFVYISCEEWNGEALALLFSALGDLLLIFSNDLVFKMGMLSFACSHIINLITFSKLATFNLSFYDLAGPIFAECYCVFLMKTTKVGTVMKIIITIYIQILALGAFSGGLVFLGTTWCMQAKWLCFIGYFMFLISDAILAYNLWIKKSKLLSFLVMFTYYIAQFMIGFGFVLGKNENLITGF